MSESTTTTEAPAPDVGDRAWRWGVRILYTTLIAAEFWILYDWWRSTPEGQIVLARWGQRLERLKMKAQECEGCAKRRAMLQAAINRMHWDAQRIVEGEDVEVKPEEP